MLKTDAPAPALSVPTLGGGRFVLADAKPEHFTLVLFYRGLHCPLCRKQMEEDVVPNLGALRATGVDAVAVSMDSRERAEKQKTDGWGFGDLPVGYAMPESTAREWGLYISEARPGSTEPPVFSEPAMTLVRPDGRVYAHWQQSVPFARPKMGDLLAGLGFIIDKDYPARGTLAA